MSKPQYESKELTEFIEKFTELVKEHKAEVYYTTDDDGIHVKVGQATAWLGFIFEGNISQ